MRPRSLPLVLVLSLVPVGGPIQAADDTVLSEARVEIVQIEAVVTDKSGTLVRDLEQRDFEIFEEGKPQVITHFARAVHKKAQPRPDAAVAVVEPAASPAPSGEAAATAPGPPGTTTVEEGRNVLLMVDDLHIALGGIDHSKKALLRVLDEFVAPDDQVALVTTSVSGVLEQWTRNHAAVRRAVEKLTVQRALEDATRMADMSPAQAELVLSGDRTATELAGRKLRAEPGSVYDSPGPQAAVQGQGSVGQGTAGMQDGMQQVAENEAKRRARGVLAQALVFSTRSFRGIEDSLRSLSRMPGRKICLLVSDGFLMGVNTTEDRTRDLQAVVDAAMRSGAVIYSLDSRGLVTSSGDPSAIGAGAFPGLESSAARHASALYQNTIGTLAEQTGGFLVQGTNDFAKGMQRMLEDNDAYYLLAFEPTNTKRDGRFRKVEVRVKRAGLTIRSGRGYVAPSDKPRPPAPALPAPMPGPRSLGDTEVRALLEQPALAAGTPVHLSADFVDVPPTGSQAIVRAHVDLGGLNWGKADKPQQKVTIEILGAVYDAQGKPLGASFAKLNEMSLTEEDVKRAKQEGLAFQQPLALPPGRYQVRLVARDWKQSVIGGANQWIEIPDLKAPNLAMSSVFLSAAAGDGAENLRDVQASRRFKRGDSLFFQLYVYNPQKDAAGASQVVMQAQLRSAGKVVAASKPQPVQFQQKDGVPLPETNGMGLEALAPGPYELRIVVVDQKANVTVQRNVDFTLD